MARHPSADYRSLETTIERVDVAGAITWEANIQTERDRGVARAGTEASTVHVGGVLGRARRRAGLYAASAASTGRLHSRTRPADLSTVKT